MAAIVLAVVVCAADEADEVKNVRVEDGEHVRGEAQGEDAGKHGFGDAGAGDGGEKQLKGILSDALKGAAKPLDLPEQVEIEQQDSSSLGVQGQKDNVEVVVEDKGQAEPVKQVGEAARLGDTNALPVGSVWGVGSSERVFGVVIVFVVALSLWVVRRNQHLRFTCDKAVSWLSHRVLLMRLPVRVADFFSSLRQKLPLRRDRSSDKRSFKNSAKKASKPEDEEIMLELKSMSLKGEYTPKVKGLPPKFSSIISESCRGSIIKQLPERLRCKDWMYLYSSEEHGYGIHSAYQAASGSGPFLFVVMDMNQYVFGAFCNESLHMGGRTYYGTGESFVFQLYPHFRVHKWSGHGEEFCVSTNDMIAFGGGGKFALWLDGSFDRGSSETGGQTFQGFHSLSSKEIFKCCAVEIWGFTTPSTVSPKRKPKFASGFAQPLKAQLY